MKKRLLFLSLFLLIVLSCKNHKILEDWRQDLAFLSQKIIFDAEYENHAWSDRHEGMYIDNEGNIYEYNLIGLNWDPANLFFLSEQELLEKFSNRQLIGTMDVETLYEKYKQIASLSNSDLSEPQDLGCRDFGITCYNAYKFDKQSSVYERTVLLVCGDGFRMNESANAESLARWLSQNIKVMLSFGETCCTPED